MKRMKLDILGTFEMRWRGTGDFWKEEYRVINRVINIKIGAKYPILQYAKGYLSI